MKPRWRILHGWKWMPDTDLTRPCWLVYKPGESLPTASFNVWENAVLYVEVMTS